MLTIDVRTKNTKDPLLDSQMSSIGSWLSYSCTNFDSRQQYYDVSLLHDNIQKFIPNKSDVALEMYLETKK